MSINRTRIGVVVALLIVFGSAVGAVVWFFLPHSWEGRAPGEWRTIEAGAFDMGSPTTEAGRSIEERQHRVTLSRGFVMQSTETTERQFFDVMGRSTYRQTRGIVSASRLRPSGGGKCGRICPARNASWHEAALYCDTISRGEGRPACYECSGEGRLISCRLAPEYHSPYDCPGYRLPTEAEWELAARGGTITSTYNGDLEYSQLGKRGPNAVLDPIAWYGGNSGYGTRPIGKKRPNAFGLMDMLGNVSEWCHDWYAPYPTEEVTDPFGPSEGTEKVHRGGSGGLAAKLLRAAARQKSIANQGTSTIGFRPVRTILAE